MCDIFLYKLEQLRKIESGKGVQYIMDEAYKVLGNPLLSHDMDYRHIAHSNDSVNDDPIWNELINNGFIGRHRQEFYKDETFFDMAAYADKVTYLPSDRLKYDRIYGKLLTKGHVQVGCVVVTACDKHFENEDIELFEYVCELLNKELYESEYYQNYGQAFMKTIVEKLLDNSFDNKLLYTAHIESIYLGLKRNIRIAVADISQADHKNIQLVLIKDLFRQTQEEYKYLSIDDYIVILIGSDTVELAIDKDFDKLNRLINEYNIYIGVSNRIQNPLEFRKYYNEAVAALSAGLKTKGSQRIFVSAATK